MGGASFRTRHFVGVSSVPSCFFMVPGLIPSAAAGGTPSWIKENIDAWREVDADPRANMHILLDECDISIDRVGKAAIRCRKATKIIQRAGIERAMFREPISPTRKLSDLKGWLVSGDQVTLALQKENILEVSDSGVGGYYYDERFVVGAFRDVQIGDIVALEYRIDQTDLSSRQQFLAIPTGVPASTVRWSLTIPKNWSLHLPVNSPNGIHATSQANRFEWMGSEIPFLPEEPYGPPGNVAQGGLVVYAFELNGKNPLDAEDWIECGQWVAEVLQPQRIDADVQSKARELTTGLTSQTEIARAICGFAVDDVRYVAVALGKGRWYPRPVHEILKTRFGDCKDKTTLARALLSSVGIPSWPVLIGAENDILSEVPSPFQFDHCILGLPSDLVESGGPARIEEGGVFLFDATAQGVPWGSLPEHLRGKHALVARSEGGQLLRVPKVQPRENRRTSQAKLTLREDGTISGTLRIEEFGLVARKRNHYLASLSGEEIKESYADILAPSLAKTRIQEMAISGEGDSSIVTTQFEATLSSSLKSGKILLPAYALRSSRDQHDLDVETRRQDLWLGMAAEDRTETEWILPTGWQFAPKEDRRNAACGGGSCEWSVEVKSGKAYHSILMVSSGTVVPKSEAHAVAEVLEQAANAQALLLIARNQP